MKKSTPLGRPQVQLDPNAFVANPDLLSALAGRSTAVPCGSDGVLFRQDEPSVGVFILHDGTVTLSMMSNDGHSLFAVQAKPGSILGLPGAISNQPYTLSAIARAGAQVSFVSNGDLTALMHSNPALSLKMLEVLAAEVRSARKAIY
ncbi:MAG: cyclic nucleotide-binding domain-containing protein [Terracidiphilus sp.]|jgi:CRP-like cAMP-binding protein